MDFSSWLKNERGAAALTIEGYLRDVALYAAWFEQRQGEPLTLEKLNRWDVADYVAHLGEQHYAPATIKRKVEALRAWVRWGQATGQLNPDFDPLAKVKVPKAADSGPKWLERDEQKRIWRELAMQANAARTPWARQVALRDTAIVTLLRYAGLRVGELCALELGDVQLAPRAGLVVVRQGKGDKQRKVPLHPEAREALEAWLAVRPDGGSAAIFVGKRGEPLSERGVQRRLAEIGRRAKVELTPHVLRHTFGHELVLAGAALTEVQPLMGHADITTTAIYVKAGANDLRRAVERLV